MPRGSKEDAIASFGLLPEVATFARWSSKAKVARKMATYWGFLDGPRGEEGEEGEWDKAWGITRIKFDPDMGLAGDEIKGGFLAKAGPR